MYSAEINQAAKALADFLYYATREQNTDFYKAFGIDYPPPIKTIEELTHY